MGHRAHVESVGIVSGEERPEGDRWFMGLDERAARQRELLGVHPCLREHRMGRRIVLGFGSLALGQAFCLE